MKRILFPTAHSENAQTIWLYTLKIARYFEASVTLMHVYQGKRITAADDFISDDFDQVVYQFEQEILELEQERLQQFTQDETPKKYHKIQFHFVVALGDIQEAILAEMQETSYDLLVLGTTTKPSTVKRLLGSTTLSLLNHSSVPLFLVPPYHSNVSIKKIVYVTDLEADQVRSIERLMQWLDAFGAQLHVLHIYRRTIAAQQPYTKMEKLRKVFEEDFELGTITYQMLEGQVVQNIQLYLSYTAADMLVLSNHKQGIFTQLFHPDITHQLVGAIKIPLLVLRQGSGQ